MRVKSYLIALVAMLLPMVASAEEVEIDGISYNVIEKAQVAEITKKTKGSYSGDIVIPSTVNYNGVICSVTSIGDGAFQNCSGLTSCTIGNSVTSIGGNAFLNCTGLTSITIPSSVTSIGQSAFSGCSGLTSVTIPESVTSIGDGTFSYCSGLTSVTIPENVTSIGGSAFNECSRLTSITIPNGVTSIGRSAFYYCRSLTSITIPSSVTSIGQSAFSGCSGLTSVTIPESVTSIGDDTFSYCSGLTSVTIPESVTSIGRSAFYYCRSLTSITIPNSVTSIGGNAFLNCTGLTSITIPNSVTSIGDGTFSYCSGLTSVTIPESVTSIGEDAFRGCTGLTSVTISESVTYIGISAFYNCTKLTNIQLGKSVKDIKSKAFGNCENLADVTCLAKSIPSTSSDAFSGSYIEYATLHVYESSINDYESKSPWSSFKSIVAADTPMYTLTYMVDGAVYKTAKYNEGDKITPEAEPSKEGYSFSGWSEIPETMPAHDVTVTGTFTVNNSKYTLTYLVDGEVYRTYQLKAGSTIIPEPEPTKEGYTFSGWSEIPEEMPAHDITITGTFTMIPLGKCASPTVDFRGGKLVFGCETEGVEYNYEISANMSLKGKGNEIPVNPAITIRVYASKEGYEDSDVSTKDVNMPSGGDINCDGVVNVADVVNVVNMISGQ